MKCTEKLDDGKECGAELLPTQKFCGKCGKKVTIDSSKLRNCSSCNSLVKLDQKFCTDCGEQFDKGQGCTKPEEMCPNETGGQSSEHDMMDKGHSTETSGKMPQYDVKVEGQNTETIGQSTNNNGIEEEFMIMHIETPCEAQPTAVDKTIPPRGLVVICSHGKFINKEFKLEERENASDDVDMMEKAWKLYGCKVMTPYYNEKKSFYKEKFIKEIEEALETIPDIKLFVFVLSTHGEEKVEVNLRSNEKEIQHYFFAKDGPLNTQELMNDIAAIEKLDGKLKLFVMQTCRSRYVVTDHNTGSENPNIDVGFDLKVTEIKCLKKSDDGQEVVDDKDSPPDDVIDKPDAKAYFPFYEDEDIHIQSEMSAISQIITEQITKKDDSKTTDDVMELIPHCDDCIVLFASMTGKYAYSTIHSETLIGGWLIKSLHDTLIKCQSEDKVHLMDILTTVNCEVGKRDLHAKKKENSEIEKRDQHENEEKVIIKSQSCFFHNIAFEEEDLYLVTSQYS